VISLLHAGWPQKVCSFKDRARQATVGSRRLSDWLPQLAVRSEFPGRYLSAHGWRRAPARAISLPGDTNGLKSTTDRWPNRRTTRFGNIFYSHSMASRTLGVILPRDRSALGFLRLGAGLTIPDRTGELENRPEEGSSRMCRAVGFDNGESPRFPDELVTRDTGYTYVWKGRATIAGLDGFCPVRFGTRMLQIASGYAAVGWHNAHHERPGTRFTECAVSDRYAGQMHLPRSSGARLA